MRAARSRRPLQLAADHGVSRVDPAGVGSDIPVGRVVARNAVARLQEVVVLVSVDVVVPLAAAEAVVLALADDAVVVLLTADDVRPLVAVARVVALPETDDVVALEAVHRVRSGLGA